VSEYNLDADARISIEGVREKIFTGANMFKVEDKLAQIHDEFEAILSNTNLALIEEIPAEKMDEISNTILELEKTTIKLGELVTK